MIEPDLFDTLEAIARNIRQNERPFGGMQLILCGE
jgi:ATP-dependent DNA helicase PIF1